MPRFEIAHIRRQGIDLVIIPLDSSFGSKTSREQQEIINELQSRVGAAGLAGTVVPVWIIGGRMYFIAPQAWHPFFRSIDLNYVASNINRELYW